MQTQIVILAGGKGKRMGGDMPKALSPLKGRLIISYLLDAVKISGVCSRPVIVVGKMAYQVREALGEEYDYVYQSEQRGTGHAVASCRPHLEGKSENILVLYGDHPCITPENIKNLAERHRVSGAAMTLMAIPVPDFSDWRKTFYSFGRIVRNPEGQIQSIVELKDCSEEQKNILEVNPSFFCFRSDWLWANIGKLKDENAQKEYYLTDLVGIAIQNGERVSSLPIDPRDAFGVNTPEDLAQAEKFIS